MPVPEASVFWPLLVWSMLVKSAYIVPPTLVLSAHDEADVAGACCNASMFCWVLTLMLDCASVRSCNASTLACRVGRCALRSANCCGSGGVDWAIGAKLETVKPVAIATASILVRTRFSLVCMESTWRKMRGDGYGDWAFA